MEPMDPVPVQALLADYPPAMRAEAEWLRTVVHRALPDALERVRAGWRIIGYDIPYGRRSAYFAWIMIESMHVHLGFPNGVLMADPERTMDGRGITKKARWVTTTPGARPSEASLAALLHEAVRVATMSRGERVALAMLREDEADAGR
jgi:hypothetical protein